MNRGRSNRFKDALTELPRELPNTEPHTHAHGGLAHANGIATTRRHRHVEDEHALGLEMDEVNVWHGMLCIRVSAHMCVSVVCVFAM